MKPTRHVVFVACLWSLAQAAFAVEAPASPVPPSSVLPGDPVPAEHPLTLAARIWGLAKYHHPAVTACDVDWDKVLLDRVDALQAATDGPGREQVLADLLAAAGTTPIAAVDADTPAWVVDADIATGLKQQLAWLADQRPQQQCYVTLTAGTRQASFDVDNGYGAGTDRAHRVLAAFRFWNAIEYFFPYKADIGRPWSQALDQHLPAILDARTAREQVLAIRGLTAAIEDSHAFLSHPPIDGGTLSGYPPFAVASIDGRAIVVASLPAATGVSPGDELLAVDGVAIDVEKAVLAPQMYGSNPAWREFLTLRNVLLGVPNPGVFRLRGADGVEYNALLPRGNVVPAPLHDEPVWQRRQLDGCSMGIVDMTRLQPGDVDVALDQLVDADALVFDIRGYPNATLWPIVARLYPQPRQIARFMRPRLDRPGQFGIDIVSIGGSRPNGYGGRILVLQDERSISQSEYSVMGLQAIGRTTVFGSQTAGADGDITRISLPGGYRATFTGLGVFYPDGRPTQRLGIVPDVHVRPTVAGLRAGRDEVLEAALDCRWLDETPARRVPAPGLYFASARDGEGVDLHHDGDTGAVLTYGYDDAGDSEWLLSAGPLESADWNRGFRRYAGAESTLVDGFDFDGHAGPYTPACARIDQRDAGGLARWQWPVDGGSTFDLCVEPLLPASAGALSGLWAGPPEEHGWGVSVHQRGDLLSVVVYAYDDAGNPRWLIGTGQLQGDGSATVALQRIRGFCRACAPQPVVSEPAGSLRLMLQADGAGSLDIDAEFAPGSRWQRDGMPLFRLLSDGTLPVTE